MNKFKLIKKILSLSFLIIIGFVIVGCKKEEELPPVNTKEYRTNVLTNVSSVITKELELGFKFFWETANQDLNSPGYGLIPDRYNTFTNRPGSVASIASVGFGLTALPIGIEADWISRAEGEERAFYTLNTMANLQRTHGFWYHFIDMNSGIRAWNSEVSIIDSAIFINGAITVGHYFGGRVQKLAYQLYEEIEWNWYYNLEVNKFYMGYSPENGFEGYWDGYAEQLMIFVLAAGSPTFPVGNSAYELMKLSSKKQSSTDDYSSFYATYTGSLFTHQFSHAWIDFSRYIDESGINWFENSINATKAAIAYAKTLTPKYPGINENSWGMSACDGPNGYRGNYGNAPSAGNAHFVDGTIPAYGALGSIVFVPESAIKAAENYYSYPRFWSKFGFKDSYNLSYSTNGWFANDIIGIDKGISTLMIENYLSGMIYQIFMEIEYIQNGLKNLNFVEVDGQI